MALSIAARAVTARPSLARRPARRAVGAARLVARAEGQEGAPAPVEPAAAPAAMDPNPQKKSMTEQAAEAAQAAKEKASWVCRRVPPASVGPPPSPSRRPARAKTALARALAGLHPGCAPPRCVGRSNLMTPRGWAAQFVDIEAPRGRRVNSGEEGLHWLSG
jgi:hypothetical protein